MAYNYGPPPSTFGQPQSYGSFPGAPPHLGPAPSFASAPGMGPSPVSGISHPSQTATSAIDMSQIQVPAGINFNAPVIRMGLPSQQGRQDRLGGIGANLVNGQRDGNRGRTGLGGDNTRSRDNNLQPLTKEEVARTIYIGGLVEGIPNDTFLEELLNVGRGLRRWSRVTDADNKLCDFGFAEYEDSSSLELATKLFEELRVPLSKNGVVEKDEQDKPKTAKLMVIIDPQSVEYIKQWTKSNENDFQFKLDTAQDDLRSMINNHTNNGQLINGHDMNDTHNAGIMEFDPQTVEQAEVVAVPAAGEDELSDIPLEMRETVAAEIAAFRERSNKRDLERLRIEEEMEKAEKERSRGGRVNRLASPPPTAPKGPGGTNNIPIGPRGNVPNGPRGFRGLQIPKDYINGVNFTQADNDDEGDENVSDEELEKRRQMTRDEELEKTYIEQEKRWLTKEKHHTKAVERMEKEDNTETAARDKKRDELEEKLKEFNDNDESRRSSEIFYKDRKEWRNQRRHSRKEERRADEDDRRAEEWEIQSQRKQTDRSRLVPADTRRVREEHIEPQAFSLNLGGFGGFGKDQTSVNDISNDKNDNKATTSTMAQVENLLDDEDDTTTTGPERKPHVPVEFKPLADGERMTDEERARASGELAKSIPNDAETLFSWKIKWEFLPQKVIMEQLRPYIQRKIMEALGVQEDLLVGSIEDIISRHGTAEEVVKELEETLDEEAEMVTRRVWKMVVFYSEGGSRGLIG